MKKWALGIDIGGTNTKFALVDREGDVREPQSFRTQSGDSFSIYSDRLKEHVHAYLKLHNLSISDVVIGVGVPNYSSVNQLLNSPVNLSWGTFPIMKAFKEMFACPIFMENDANVAALGEHLWGGATGCDNFVVITVGTGIGSGVFANGHLVVGHTGQAGEGGHLIVGEQNRPCNCGGVDHFECYCSVAAIKEFVKERTGEDMRYHDISAKFLAGDEAIRDVFRHVAVYFARGLHQLMVCFSPSNIILAGGGMVVGEDYLNMISSELDKIIYKPMRGSVEIKISTLSTSSGAVLGAAALAFERQINVWT